MAGTTLLTFSLASIVDSGHVEGSVAAGLSFVFLVREFAFVGISSPVDFELFELLAALGIVSEHPLAGLNGVEWT